MILKILYHITRFFNNIQGTVKNGLTGLYYPELKTKGLCFDCKGNIKEKNGNEGCWCEFREIKGKAFSVPICNECSLKNVEKNNIEGEKV